MHIEQAALRVHGELISGTGLEDIVQAAGINIIGLKTAVCDVNDIEKARYRSCSPMSVRTIDGGVHQIQR